MCSVLTTAYISIPHGPNFAVSAFLENLQTKNEVVSRTREQCFDIELLPSLTKRNSNNSEQEFHVLGSSRFDQQWITKLDFLVPEYKFPNDSKPKLKILWLLAKTKYPITDIQKTLCLIKKISDISCVQLVVKPHPRDVIPNFSETINMTVVGPKTSSSALIRWADLVLFTHTSAVLEALVRDKPIGYLKYLVTSPALHEQIKMSWMINGEDELEALVSRLISHQQVRTYSKKERNDLLRLVVHPKGKNVCTLYSRFLLKELDKNF